jgi:hypothetical protein
MLSCAATLNFAALRPAPAFRALSAVLLSVAARIAAAARLRTPRRRAPARLDSRNRHCGMHPQNQGHHVNNHCVEYEFADMLLLSPYQWLILSFEH